MCLRDVYVTTRKLFILLILYMNIIFIEQWPFRGNSEIWLCSDVFACRQKLCKPDSIFKQTRNNLFYRENMTSFSITATLRTLNTSWIFTMQMREHSTVSNMLSLSWVCKTEIKLRFNYMYSFRWFSPELHISLMCSSQVHRMFV